jgi:hypothetical protein
MNEKQAGIYGAKVLTFRLQIRVEEQKNVILQQTAGPRCLKVAVVNRYVVPATYMWEQKTHVFGNGLPDPCPESLVRKQKTSKSTRGDGSNGYVESFLMHHCSKPFDPN